MPWKKEDKYALFKMIESNLHPVSRCLREELLSRQTGLMTVGSTGVGVIETIGYGLTFESGESIWTLGRPGWLGNNVKDPVGAFDSNHPDRYFDSEFARNGKVLAQFTFIESIREDAPDLLRLLVKDGFDIFILSGDRQQKVASILKKLGLPPDHGLGGMSPGEKAKWIVEGDSDKTLFIGDGANDSLAFDHAACRGTPVVDKGLLEHKADFFFLGRGLAAIRHLIEVAAVRRSALVRIFTFAVIYNVIAAVFCLAGKMNPLLAAILMPVSSIVTIALVGISFKGSYPPR